MHVLAGRQYDHIFAAADDIQEAIRIDLAEIAAAKPTVLGKRIGCCSRILIIALEDHCPADQNLADAVFVGIENFDLRPLHWLADRADTVVILVRRGRGTACFRESVTLNDGKTKSVKILSYRIVKTRTGRDRDTQFAAKRIVDRPKEFLAKVDIQLVAKETVGLEHRAKQCLHRLWFRRNGVKDFFVKNIPKPRYGGEDRRFENLHRLAKFSRS